MNKEFAEGFISQLCELGLPIKEAQAIYKGAEDVLAQKEETLSEEEREQLEAQRKREQEIEALRSQLLG